jgi:hypothetical protein
MKNSLIALSFVLSSLGIFAQQMDSISANAQDNKTDFSNPSQLFTQTNIWAGLLGGLNSYDYLPSVGGFDSEISVEIARGSVSFGTSLGFSNRTYFTLESPALFLKYRFDFKKTWLSGLQLQALGRIPIIPESFYDDQHLPFSNQHTGNIGLQAMLDMPFSQRWRINPYVRFDYYTFVLVPPSYSVRVTDTSYTITETSITDQSFNEFDITIGAYVTNHFSKTHFVQFNAWYNARNLIPANDPTAERWGDASLNGLFGLRTIYNTAFAKDLMFFTGLGIISGSNLNLNVTQEINPYEAEIFLGLRWGW